MSREEIDLIAHLMRRAGFGASWDELKVLEENGYDATLAALLDFPTVNVRMELALRHGIYFCSTARKNGAILARRFRHCD